MTPLHLRTVSEEEAKRTFPARILNHAQLDYNAAAVIITSAAGERFGYFMWHHSHAPPPIPVAPDEKEGILFIDDPTRACGDEECEGGHFLEAACNYLEMASAASKLLGS